MSDSLLATKSTEGLTSLGSPNQRSPELIAGTVLNECGPRHAAIFAEPVATQYGDRIDWYASVEGKAVPLASLDEEARAEAEAVLGGLIEDIREKAEGYLTSKLPDDQRLGEALANALVYPGPDYVYVIGSGKDLQPVIIQWAWSEDSQPTVQTRLGGTSKTRPAAPEPSAAAAAAAAQAETTAAAAPVAPPPERRPGNWWWLVWLGWLLLAVMLGTILYLMIAACALKLPGVPNYCPVPEIRTEDHEQRAAILRDQIAAVERQIAIADRSCQPDPLEEAALVPPPRPVRQADAIDRRLQQLGAQKGDLTFSLIWDGPDDLDLHVTCPPGGTINFRSRNACNGTLDVDSNARNPIRTPVENIYFNGPPVGNYDLRVHLFKSRTSAAPRPFQLRIVDRGNVQTLSGVVSPSGASWTHKYQTRGL